MHKDKNMLSRRKLLGGAGALTAAVSAAAVSKVAMAALASNVVHISIEAIEAAEMPAASPDPNCQAASTRK